MNIAMVLNKILKIFVRPSQLQSVIFFFLLSLGSATWRGGGKTPQEAPNGIIGTRNLHTAQHLGNVSCLLPVCQCVESPAKSTSFIFKLFRIFFYEMSD